MHGLTAHVNQNELDALSLALPQQVFHAVQCADIHRGNALHVQNQCGLAVFRLHIGDFIGGAEEHGTGDLHHLDPGCGNYIVVLRDAFPHVELVCHPLHKQQAGQHQAHANGNHQVIDHRQRDGQNQHGNVALGGLFQLLDHGTPAAHIIGHLEQNGGNAGHGNQRRIGHQQNQEQQQYYGVDHTGHGAAASVFDVGGGPGNGTGGGNASEQRAGRVGRALGHQLHIGVVLASNHVVCHHGGEQGLNGRQNGNGKGVRNHRGNGIQMQHRHVELGRRIGNGIQVSDGVHRQAGQLHQQGGRNHRHQRSGDFLGELGPKNQDCQGEAAHQQGRNTQRSDGGDDFLQFIHGPDGGILELQTQEILNLSNGNGDGDAGGKTGGDGIGDEANQASQMQKAHHNQEQARQ